ncbi:hypothetical protein HDU67_009140 [Dinochytrium kinnereticum]|nr:hypothetical protein HDU67_009140 [Dinochytrium kinnereticum]
MNLAELREDEDQLVWDDLDFPQGDGPAAALATALDPLIVDDDDPDFDLPIDVSSACCPKEETGAVKAASEANHPRIASIAQAEAVDDDLDFDLTFDQPNVSLVTTHANALKPQETSSFHNGPTSATNFLISNIRAHEPSAIHHPPFEKWPEDSAHHQENKYPRRYRASPSPSSNTSVVASDGEEDEGFDDIEMPEQLSTIIRTGDRNIGAAIPGGRRGRQETGSNDMPNQSGIWNCESDNISDGIEIPDDFGWNRPEASNRPGLRSSITPSKTQSRSQEVSSGTPSKIPVLRKNSNQTPLVSGPSRMMALETSTTDHLANPTHRLSIPVNGAFFGDGTELDALEDIFEFSNNPILNEEKTKRTLRMDSKPNGSNASNAIDKGIGGMTFNPSLQQWEGNEEVLLEFDKATSISKLRPALITHHGYSKKMPQVVGSMVFDPVKMKWIGNDDDDVFADLADADNLSDSTARTDAVSHFTELDLSKSLKQALYMCESSHKLFIGKWYPKALTEGKNIGRDTSKVHLHDLRRMKLGLDERRSLKV